MAIATYARVVTNRASMGSELDEEWEKWARPKSKARDSSAASSWKLVSEPSPSPSRSQVPFPPHAPPQVPGGDCVPSEKGASLCLLDEEEDDMEVSLSDVGKECKICKSLFSKAGEFCSYSCQTKDIVSRLPFATKHPAPHPEGSTSSRPLEPPPKATVSLRAMSSPIPERRSMFVPHHEAMQRIEDDSVFIEAADNTLLTVEPTKVSALDKPEGWATHVLVSPYSGLKLSAT